MLNKACHYEIISLLYLIQQTQIRIFFFVPCFHTVQNYILSQSKTLGCKTKKKYNLDILFYNILESVEQGNFINVTRGVP
jgi:hypothetical protein